MDLATLEQQISTAIGQQETGSGTAGVGATMNNPGGLKYADWETQFGATPTASGFAKFPNQAAGQNALSALVSRIVNGGASLSSLISQWSPPADGNTNNADRVSQLAAATKLDPSQPIAAQASQAALPGVPADVAAQANPDQAAMQAAGAVDNSTQTGGSWGRIAAFLVGLVCLVMGLLLLKQTQIVIQNTRDTVAKGAEMIGAAAAI